jgi:catechol 2,3-dioxygenase-like lactoylglutathione lyase family enzyme
MFSHIMLGANDLEASKQFYDSVLGTLGIRPGRMNQGKYFYVTSTGVFSITKPLDGNLASPANGGTIGFAAKSIEEVDRFHEAALANGGTECEGNPVHKDTGAGMIYIGWMRDPVGNKICAMYRHPK